MSYQTTVISFSGKASKIFRSFVAATLIPAQVAQTTVPAATIGIGALTASTLYNSKSAKAEPFAAMATVAGLAAAIPDVSDWVTGWTDRKFRDVIQHTTNILENQDEIIKTLKEFKISMREEIERGFLNNDVKTLQARAGQFKILTANPDKESSRKSLKEISNEVDFIATKLGTYGPATVTAYISAASLQYALHKAVESPTDVVKEISSQHQKILGKWMDPANPESIPARIEAMKDEISTLQKFVDTPRSIVLEEAVQVWKPYEKAKHREDVWVKSYYYAGKGGERIFKNPSDKTEPRTLYFQIDKKASYNWGGDPTKPKRYDSWNGGFWLNIASYKDRKDFPCLDKPEKWNNSEVPKQEYAYGDYFPDTPSFSKERVISRTQEPMEYSDLRCIPKIYAQKAEVMERLISQTQEMKRLESGIEAFSGKVSLTSYAPDKSRKEKLDNFITPGEKPKSIWSGRSPI